MKKHLSILALTAALTPLPLGAADALHDALTFYASFDQGTDADMAKGDKKLYTITATEPDSKTRAGNHTDGATILAEGQGRTGNALRFTKRSAPWLFYKGEDNFAYAKKNWSGTVSLWLKLDPEEDLEPGYTDPIQITTRQWNDGAFFVDFDKEGDPRDFRLGVFPDLAVWNPENKEVPESERPLVVVKNPPFAGDKWTHVLFTFKNFNTGNDDGVAAFWLDGKKQGEITGWKQQFTWKDEEESRILIGLNYVGLLDDVACFNRVLTDEEIQVMYRAEGHDETEAEEKEDASTLNKAFIDGTGPGWRAWGEADFVNVNCDPDTWRWENGTAHCTGQPVGVIRSKEPLENLELVVEWMHLESGGNSGVFLWASPESIRILEAGEERLPHGIEVQVLDLGYAEKYEKEHGKPSDWFTSHGDVFPTGPAKMTPFPPASPNGMRSFPSKNLTKGINEWNHYYVRAINGEVRLWVNGEEVSGGTGCEPSKGYLCLESEGAPVVFRNLRVRELP